MQDSRFKKLNKKSSEQMQAAIKFIQIALMGSVNAAFFAATPHTISTSSISKINASPAKK